jgi:hypothetical protein
MDDATLRDAKDLAQNLTAALAPFEKLIYRIEDVLLLHHRRLGLIFFATVLGSYLALYALLRGATFSVLLLAASAVAFRPSQNTIAWLLRPFLSADVLPLRAGRRRFHVGQIAAFLAAGWYLARWCGDGARRSARARDLPGIATAFAGLGAALFAALVVPEGALGLLALLGALLAPLACDRLSNGRS